jgi:uncharacterized protein YkwD
MLDLVNAERAKGGLAPVSLCPSLTRAAQAYADKMSAEHFFDHTSPDGSTMTSRTNAAGYRNWSALAENIGQGYGDVTAVMKGWMGSTGHRANIMNPKLQHIGVGWTRSGNYWVQDFGASGTC